MSEGDDPLMPTKRPLHVVGGSDRHDFQPNQPQRPRQQTGRGHLVADLRALADALEVGREMPGAMSGLLVIENGERSDCDVYTVGEPRDPFGSAGVLFKAAMNLTDFDSILPLEEPPAPASG